MASRAVSGGNVAQRTLCITQQEAGRALHVSMHSQGLESRKADCHGAPICLGSPPGSWHLVLPHLSARGHGPAEPLGRRRNAHNHPLPLRAPQRLLCHQQGLDQHLLKSTEAAKPNWSTFPDTKVCPNLLYFFPILQWRKTSNSFLSSLSSLPAGKHLSATSI